MDEPREFFTVVFEGRLRDIDRNPFKVESPFGRAVAAGMGDALSRLDLVEDLLAAADKALRLTEHCIEQGIHEVEINGSTESIADLSADLQCVINVAERR